MIGAATGLITIVGGWIALGLGSRGSALAGFSSGAVIGVALTDLLPEALTLGQGAYAPLTLTALMAAGFMAYLIIGAASNRVTERPHRLLTHLGPASLVFHSLMDGLGIGLAFNVSIRAGVVVAAAVLAHDLVDGANTVTLSKASDLGARSTRRWLGLDAAAPLGGLALSRMIHPSPPVLAALLAVFAGLFLYIGAAELLPKSRRGSPGLSGALWTALGAAVIYAIVSLSG